MEVWLSVGALIIALIAIPATIWATRQWGNRRARMEFAFSSIPLLPSNTREGLLEVTYRDIPVKDPHLVSVTLRNTGPRDIASAAFDESQPISIRFNQTFYGLTNSQCGVRTISPAIGTPASEAVVQVQPGLLKRGEEWSFSAVLTGPVEVSINAPLIDTDVTHVVADSDSEIPEITVRFALPFASVEMPLRRRAGKR
jgi:hypothetical protein